MRPILRNVLMSATLAVSAVTAGFVVGLTPTPAWAGPNSEEIWFGTGADSLETNDEGVVTPEGEKTKTKEVDRIPSSEDWELKLHARMGKYAAEGPLYVEFYQTIQDKEHIVMRHEDPDYAGDRLYTAVIELQANIGFNKDREYRVQIVQNNGQRDLVLAQGKVKLIDTGRKAEGEDEEEEGGEEEGEEEAEEEGEEEAEEEEEGEAGGEAGGSGEAPPPIEEPGKKKGCSVGPSDAGDLGAMGATGLGILLLAAGIRRRRND
jgi:MYXO-CTERM domain-containing protein